MGARVGKGERQHEKKRRKAKADVAYHRPAHSPDFQADVGGHLHDGRPGNRLAEGHAVLKGLAVKPLLLPDGHLADVGDHGGTAEGGDPHPQKRTKQLAQ